MFVQVVSTSLGWSPLSSLLVIWSPSGDTRGPSVVFEAVVVPCTQHELIFLTLLITSANVVLCLVMFAIRVQCGDHTTSDIAHQRIE